MTEELRGVGKGAPVVGRINTVDRIHLCCFRIPQMYSVELTEPNGPTDIQMLGLLPLLYKARDVRNIAPRCSRDAAEMQPRRSRDAAEMQPRCSRDAAEIRPQKQWLSPSRRARPFRAAAARSRRCRA